MNEVQKEVINSMKRELENVKKHIDTPRVTEDSVLYGMYQKKKAWVEEQINEWEKYFNS